MGLLSNRRRVLSSYTYGYDYEVEYLEVNADSGLAYIDTGLDLSGDGFELSIISEVIKLNHFNDIIFIAGDYNIPSLAYYRWGQNNTLNNLLVNSAQDELNKNTNAINTISTSRTITLELANNNVFWSSKISPNNTSILNTENLPLENQRFYLFSPTITRQMYVRIYSFMLKQNGVTLLDMIPVCRNDVGYMYDKVSHKLFGAKGGGQFTIGQKIEQQ